MICHKCGKQCSCHYPGKVGPCCWNPNEQQQPVPKPEKKPKEPKKMGRPVCSVPFDKAAYMAQYHRENPRTEYFRNYKRKKSTVIHGEFLLFRDGFYRTRTDGKPDWTADKDLATVFKTLGRIKRSVRQLGRGQIITLTKQEQN